MENKTLKAKNNLNSELYQSNYLYNNFFLTLGFLKYSTYRTQFVGELKVKENCKEDVNEYYKMTHLCMSYDAL